MEEQLIITETKIDGVEITPEMLEELSNGKGDENE